MKWTLTALAIFSSFLVWSNPSGYEVVHGEAQVTHLTNVCHIHAKDHTIIHWKDFSIGVNELTQFIQPSANSVVLNRVITDLPSEILGTLQANGKLFLLNQNGILFGENAIVNVGELIASTLPLSNEDFLKGETLHFYGPSKTTIINHGTINASSGNVTLLSRHIINTGTICSREGKTELIAATEVFLQPQDKKHILIRPSTDETADVGIYHQGKIEAIEAYLQADGPLYDLAIKNEGEIDALIFKEQGGYVYLCAENGSIALSGKICAPRGEIIALGKNVYVLDGADLAVSDLHQPGNIHLGKGSDVTFVAHHAHLEANAIKFGSGGNIFCLSDGTSLFLGKAEVRGGLYGGDGGFIEVSGAHSTLFHGLTDRFAPFGTSGTLLLDPEANFVISTAFNYNYDSILSTKMPTADKANLTIDTLLAELQTGPVTIQTSFEGEGGLPGHIQLGPDINHSYESPHSLTLYSTGSEGILWNGKLVNTGKGNVELIAKNGKIQFTPQSPKNPAFIQTAGNISLDSSGPININGAAFQFAGIKTSQSGQIFIQSQENVTLTSAQKAPAFIHVENGSLSIDTPGSLTLHGLENAPAELRSTGKGDITINTAESINLLAESGPALISLSHRYGHLLIDTVKHGIELNALGDTAAIEGGLGSITFKHIDADINLLADHGCASISSIGPIHLQTAGSIHLDAQSNNATISSYQLIQGTIGNNLLLTAEDGNASVISAQGMMLHTKEDVLLNGTATGQAFLRSPNTHLFIGHDLELFSHTLIDAEKGPLLISVGHDLSMSNPFTTYQPSITGANVKITIVHDLHMSHNSILEASRGPLNLSVGETAYFDHAARLISNEGLLNVQSLQGNIHFSHHSSACSNTDSLSISAGKSIILEGFSYLESHGEKGMTLLVDELYPNTIGQGGFILGYNASLSSSDAPIQLYTAKRCQNAINGTLNGYRLAAAPLYINTKEEFWGVFYPRADIVVSTPYTVFHKENGLVEINSLKISQKDFIRVVANFTGPFVAELFRDLHPYNEYTADSECFTVTYPGEYFSKIENFSLKRPTFRHRSFNKLSD